MGGGGEGRGIKYYFQACYSLKYYKLIDEIPKLIFFFCDSFLVSTLRNVSLLECEWSAVYSSY